MTYLLVKWLHIVLSTLIFGTGIGSAFYLLFASLRRDAALAAGVARMVVWADWLFTATTAVLQPLTGLWLVHLGGVPLSTPWVTWSIVLYVVAIACWLPVVDLQIRARPGRCRRASASGAAPGLLALLPPMGGAGYPRLLRFHGNLLSHGREAGTGVLNEIVFCLLASFREGARNGDLGGSRTSFMWGAAHANGYAAHDLGVPRHGGRGKGPRPCPRLSPVALAHWLHGFE